MASGTTFRARTAPAIIAGILLLIVPVVFLTYEFFLYAAYNGGSSLQSGQLLTLLKQFGLADVLVFILLPLITAIAAFKRGKGFLAIMAALSAIGWGFDLYVCISLASSGTYKVGFLIQMGLWALAWLVLFIVCLAGMRKPKVGIRVFPWVLGLGAMLACAIQWFIELGGLGAVQFDGSNIMFVAAFTDMGANFLLALAMLFLSLAVGKASAKDALAMADAKAAKRAAKDAAKQEKALKSGHAGSLPEATPVATPAGSATPSYGFTPAPETIELTAKGDPFAGAMAALDEAGNKISLTLDGANTASPAPAPSLGYTPASLSQSSPYGPAATSASARAVTSATATGTSTAARQMSELTALLKEGILTQAEFDAAKAKLMK